VHLRVIQVLYSYISRSPRVYIQFNTSSAALELNSKHGTCTLHNLPKFGINTDQHFKDAANALKALSTRLQTICHLTNVSPSHSHADGGEAHIQF
jgi:hypothetical protein